MCNCGGKPNRTWTVTYPDGRTEVKRSETAARSAATRGGGTYVENPKAA